ncbi:MAG: endonuclease [Deltaproteobacteria bacterium CG11_big_fil_rev_8_21_14_0_20_49_13]|nr:MAG: endonuclease [Deltaproteobacteria bacterium CG11_big_fil_rev_8_21_14_0_20_49_13]
MKKLLLIYDRLFKAFGPQHWWPGETPFEVMVGAILTQNTNWGNVERAIANLKKADLLDPYKLLKLPPARLAGLIRPAGYFNVKAKRLRNFLKFFTERYDGSAEKMKAAPLHELREELLSVNGVGRETADSILLYALDKTIFVCDAYTYRILNRHSLAGEDADYNELQSIFMDGLPEDVGLFNEYHALIVRVGKEFCKPKPNCHECPLEGLL